MIRYVPRARKVLRLIRQPRYRAALLSRVAAAIEHEPAMGEIQPKTVIDVGANKGQFSLLVRAHFPNAWIHAFEPLDEPAQIYRRVFRKDQRVILHPVALGNRNGIAEINIAKRDDSSSLLAELPLQQTIFPETKQI